MVNHKGSAEAKGEDGCHLKLVMLFQTLHTNRDLCSLIKKLGEFLQPPAMSWSTG